jgi:outer membrane protein TolC
MKKIILFILILPLLSRGQAVLSLKNAIDSTLRNSFDIRIAGNNAEVSKINNSYGVAGGLPTVTAGLNDNQSLTNVYQKLNSGTEIEKSNASGNSMTSNITAGLLLFNGFRVVATKERLESLQKQSELQLNVQVQTSIAAVMVKFYDIVRQQEYLKILQTSRDVSQTKLTIITERKNVGMANDADYLQAMIDLNSSEQVIRNQQLVVEQAKTDLLQLMSRKKFYPFTVNDSITIDRSLQLTAVINYLKQNPQYLAAEQQVRISEQVVKEVNAQRYPSLRVTSGINLNRSQSAAGFTLVNQNYGPFAGLSLSVPIYNGNTYRTQQEAAIYNVSNARLQKENLLNDLEADAVKTYQSYSTNMTQIEEQEKTIGLSSRLIDLVMQRFRVNQATILEVKAAQASYESAGYQLVNLKYAAKVAEIELKRLMYSLGE